MSSAARFIVAALAIVASAAVALLQLHAPIEARIPWRAAYFDTLTQAAGRFAQAHPRTAVHLIAIDDASIQKSREPWPWPQARLDALTKRLQEQHPRLLITDLTPSGDAPVAASTTLNLDSKLAEEQAAVRAAAGAPPTAHALPLLVSKDGVLKPSPELASVLVLTGASKVQLVASAQTAKWPLAQAGVRGFAANGHFWATAPDARLRLLPEGARTGLTITPVSRVAEGQLPAISGSIVLVRRANATETDEGWQRAQGLAQLVNGLTPHRSQEMAWAEAGLAVLASFVVALAMVNRRTSRAASLLVLTGVLGLAASVGLFVFKLALLDPVAPVVFALPAFLLGALGGLGAARTAPGGEASPRRERARGGTIRGATLRDATVLVCRLRDLDKIGAAYRDRPKLLVQAVSKLMSTVADTVSAHRGTIEHFGGGELVAIFNAPAEDHRHTEHAAEAALAILGKLEPLNEDIQTQSGENSVPSMDVSIGIETAECIAGDLGFKDRGEISIIGPAVDWAHALASRAEKYGPAILVGPGAHERANKTFALLQLDVADIGGEPKPFYALMGNPVARANPRFKALQEGFSAFHAAYRKGSWDQAGALLEQCAKLPGANAQLVALYENRLAFLKNTNPAGWNGILRPPVQ